MFALGILNLFGKHKRDEGSSPAIPKFSGDLAVFLQDRQDGRAQPEVVLPDIDQSNDKDGVVVLLSFMAKEVQDDYIGWICTECGTHNITSDYCEVCGLKYVTEQ